ncbi:hypothetical protein ACXZ1K_14230 [Pedobacter sp. PWIIR3]
MELEELKANWELLGKKLEKQELLTTKLIQQMTTRNYKNKVNRIVYPEFIGGSICLIGAVVVLVFFARLDTLCLQIMGVLSFLLLLLMPFISYLSLRGIQTIDIGVSSYSKTLENFAVKRIRFQQLQKLAAVVSAIFMFVFLPTCFKLFANKDLTLYTTFWLFALPGCAFVIFIIAKKVLGHYNHALRQAQDLLREVRE